jgi:large subunit ribosomal protein L17
MSYLQNKESVTTLFGEVAGRTSERPGGYTRIIKLGDARLGDNAEMCLLELVDFNDVYKTDKDAKKAKTRRSRGVGKKTEVVTETEEVPAKEPKAQSGEKKPKKVAKKDKK